MGLARETAGPSPAAARARHARRYASGASRRKSSETRVKFSALGALPCVQLFPSKRSSSPGLSSSEADRTLEHLKLRKLVVWGGIPCTSLGDYVGDKLNKLAKK